jgi:hypothetical protein
VSDAAILAARTSERLLFGEPTLELDGTRAVVNHAAHAEKIAFGEFQERTTFCVSLDGARAEPVLAAHSASVGARSEARRSRCLVENGWTMTWGFPECAIPGEALLGRVVARERRRRTGRLA